MSNLRLVFTALVAMCVLFLVTGCSVIGLTFGTVVDAVSPDEYVFTASGVDSIKKGVTVEVVRADSSTVLGDFEKLEPVHSNEYTVRYQQFTNSMPVEKLMPALGDSILIVKHGTLGRGELRGLLLGFDKEKIRVHLAGWKEPASVLVEAVDTMRNNRTAVVDGNTLRYHMSRDDIPYMTALIITTKQGTEAIYLNDVLRIRQPLSHNGAYIGGLIGTAIDLAIIAGLFELMR